MEFEINHKDDLNEISVHLIERIKFKQVLPCLIALDGDLGSGKTTFVQQFFKTLGLSQAVTSPTFGKIHEYHLEKYNLYHLDLYRAKVDFCELEEIFCDARGIICIEWFSKVQSIKPAFHIYFQTTGEESRKVRIEEHYEI